MQQAELSRMVRAISQQFMQTESPGYFECVEALDDLEFYILDRIEPGENGGELATLREEAARLHGWLTDQAQAAIDGLIQDIRTQKLSPSDLKALFNQFSQSVPDKSELDAPGFDLFDSFLG